MIDAAKYYIYIEVEPFLERPGLNRSLISAALLLQNQFFITISSDSVVRNQLAEAMFRRVLRAKQYVHG